ncbi:MAG: putative enoyl-CoA hydratase [Nocardioidaceae bacterium]|nr:putative enoyl-CoA hydratase [Nocardioidaceae bacterium]
MSVHVDIKNHIATVTLDRPPVNALSVDAMEAITRAFNEISRSREAHVAVLAAAGDKVFCAGADFKDSERRYSSTESNDDVSPVDLLDKGRVVRECFNAIHHAEVPVIASVHGAALGSGLGMVAASDIIIASERATFGLPEINVGVMGGGRYLQRMVGVYKMRTMFFTGRPISADEMYRMGAVERVVKHEDLADATAELAEELASKSPTALRLGKQSLNRAESLSVEEGYRVEQEYTARATSFKDSKEARDSFREKRTPSWTWN